MEERNETKELQSARRSRKRNGRKSLLPLVLLFALVAVILGLWYRQFGPSRTRISENSLFGVQGDEVAVLYNYELQSDKAVLENGSVYLPLTLVKREMNQRFYWGQGREVPGLRGARRRPHIYGGRGGHRGQAALFCQRPGALPLAAAAS